MDKETLARWVLIHGGLYNEFKAAGCCGAWLLKLARARSVADATALLRSAEGMAFCAEHNLPSLDSLRATERVVNLANFSVYLDGAGGGFERWARGGGAVFAGAARSVVRCVRSQAYSILALHGAELDVYARGGARVQILLAAGTRAAVHILDDACNVLRWDCSEARWLEVRRRVTKLEG